MRHRRSVFAVLGLLGLLVSNFGCDSADNPVAPSGSVLTVSANPTRISLNGQSTITVIGFRPDGNPLANGTLINLATDLGVLAQTVIEVSGGGRASTTLSGDGTAGTATLTASLPGSGGEGGASGTATVQIGESAETSPSLSITASPNVVNLGDSAEITAVARNSDGSLFGAGGSVSLRTDLGTLRSGFVNCSGAGSSSVIVETDAASEAKATLCAGDQPGTATITGSIGSSEEATASVTVENQKPQLIINANPTNIASTESSTITIIARDQNDVPLGAGFRIQLLASFGTLSPENPVTNADGLATSAFDPDGEFGDAEIQAFLGTSDIVTVTITVRGDVERVTFTTIPETIQDEDQEVRLVARALNARNEGVPSVIAQFEVNGVNGRFELPNSNTSSDGTVQTNASGDAVIDLVLLAADLTSGQQFEVKVTIATEIGEVEATRTIRVQ